MKFDMTIYSSTLGIATLKQKKIEIIFKHARFIPGSANNAHLHLSLLMHKNSKRK